jgi:hypothetical protein
MCAGKPTGSCRPSFLSDCRMARANHLLVRRIHAAFISFQDADDIHWRNLKGQKILVIVLSSLSFMINSE